MTQTINPQLNTTAHDWLATHTRLRRNVDGSYVGGVPSCTDAANPYETYTDTDGVCKHCSCVRYAFNKQCKHERATNAAIELREHQLMTPAVISPRTVYVSNPDIAEWHCWFERQPKPFVMTFWEDDSETCSCGRLACRHLEALNCFYNAHYGTPDGREAAAQRLAEYELEHNLRLVYCGQEPLTVKRCLEANQC